MVCGGPILCKRSLAVDRYVGRVRQQCLSSLFVINQIALGRTVTREIVQKTEKGMHVRVLPLQQIVAKKSICKSVTDGDDPGQLRNFAAPEVLLVGKL